MSGAASESGAGRSFEGAFSEPVQQQRCQSGEALVEWRSSDQVENGTPSTSPPYWDIDDDDDGGPKPSELYGKHTWKIDKFSQINKRELRSNAFEVGGYKWYILIYPQGCDVCNHLSLFLCVANHDKLLPGWSHFAQFTIAVVNKDPKKSKYSDTLHRFWKKEHDWGWKKFMELSKVMDGFIDADTLIIKAQVQVIRERADRPFRCLDCQYRRELVRVYLSNVEQSCRRFVEERRGKLGKLIEDKARWSSFCAFWLSMDQNSRRRMSREKSETILKVVVKHFFQEKEVTSTLVMDSLYSGLKALEGQYKGKKSKGKSLEAGDFSVPIVRMEKDMFMLVDDVLPLLERAAVEPLPPKDEKGPQNRTKDGALGEEFNKDSIERDERRLTELGRRTIEIFILAHVFSKIEVAYQEAVALKKQEELIREEEEAGLAEIEHRARRGAADKEKKSKKKQGKQKRNNRKPKDKGRDEKSASIAQDKTEQDICTVPMEELLAAKPEMVIEKSDTVEDVSDMSDSVECVPEILPPDSEDRDVSPVNWDTDNSEVHPPTEASSSGISGLSSVQNGTEGRSSSVVDDSSSTCSTDSVPSVVISVPQIGNSRFQKNKKSPSRERNHENKLTSGSANWDSEKPGQPSKALQDAGNQVDASLSVKAIESRVRVVNGAERNVTKEETDSQHGEHVAKDLDVEVSTDRAACVPRSPSKKTQSVAPSKYVVNDPIVKKSASASPRQADRSVSLPHSAENATRSTSDTQTSASPNPPEKPVTNPVHGSEMASTPVMSRPLSAPVFPSPMPPVSVVPTVQVGPALARSVSAVGRLMPEPTASASQSYAPLSYRNAIMGPPVSESSAAYTPNHSASPMVNASYSYSQVPPLVSTPLFSPYTSGRVESHQIKPSFSFGMLSHRDTFQNGSPWETSRNVPSDRAALLNGMQNFDPFGSIPAGTSGRQTHGLQDEFPHLDIINDLLDDEHGIFNPAIPNLGDGGFGFGPQYLNRHYTFPGDPAMGPTTSSCRFERARSYPDDGSPHNYDMLGDSMPQGPYANGQVDGLVPNQWGMAGSEMAFHMRNNENDGYPYHIPEYQNLTVGVNGYTIFRPSNGF